MTEKQRLAIFHLCASMLGMNGIISERERKNAHKRIMAHKAKHKIEITEKELLDGVDFKINKILK